MNIEIYRDTLLTKIERKTYVLIILNACFLFLQSSQHIQQQKLTPRGFLDLAFPKVAVIPVCGLLYGCGRFS